jgi:hypothetical protein
MKIILQYNISVKCKKEMKMTGFLSFIDVYLAFCEMKELLITHCLVHSRNGADI